MKIKKVFLVLTVAACLIFSGCQSVPVSNMNDNTSIDESYAADMPSSESIIESMPQSETDDKKAVSSKTTVESENMAKKISSKQTESSPSSNVSASSETVKSAIGVAEAENIDDGYDEQEIIDQILKLVNQERREKQLEPLSQNEELDKSALIRSQEMADNGLLSHVRPDGKTWTTSFEESGYSEKYEHAYENIALGDELLAIYGGEVDNYDVAKTLFDSWKQSEPHYAVIINPQNTQTGIGVTRVGNSIYSTEHFAEVDKADLSLR